MTLIFEIFWDQKYITFSLPKAAVIRKGTEKKPPETYIDQQNQAVEYIYHNGRKDWNVEQGVLQAKFE